MKTILKGKKEFKYKVKYIERLNTSEADIYIKIGGKWRRLDTILLLNEYSDKGLKPMKEQLITKLNQLGFNIKEIK